MSSGHSETSMPADRVVAYSDGVIAIIVTIMVLELHAPRSNNPMELLRMWPTLGAYALSFVLVSIYWVNHHQLLHANRRMTIASIWFNIHWLFWLSLFPFATSYLNIAAAGPVALACYGALSLIVALAYRLLATSLSHINSESDDRRRIARDRRNLNTLAGFANLCAIPAAYVSRTLAVLLLVMPAALYFLPEMKLGVDFH